MAKAGWVTASVLAVGPVPTVVGLGAIAGYRAIKRHQARKLDREIAELLEVLARLS
jgi:hypothetical protein